MVEYQSINRTNDYAFKRIMGSEEGKEALISFLNAVLKPAPGKELVWVELLDREMEEIAMGNPGIRKAMTIEQIFFKNQQERRLYELREKSVRDEISMMTGAKAQGLAEGVKKGVNRRKGANGPSCHLQIPGCQVLCIIR
ncbi:hypothetical protein Dred_3119 [Desulforamulus reducens MI-1]|uniref:Uncharacterized protein n=1 Tax=Desulforamulus reducens (strain ATCC BAA-1160 / DSM 100696 / MI-1) TaxID=349161 RepID=A4J968_DESRM|nr:PD-(D/E)XK nuclease family transposase [Desulforamulus reducens]ABO51621.1 hypothetical protein Dred_3119 [Desulforamulus reducens MI-1]